MPGFALVCARPTGRALAANVKISNRPTVNVLGIVTNSNRPGSLWRWPDQQAGRYLSASRPRSWPVNVLGIVTNGNKPGFALVRARSTSQVQPTDVKALQGW